MSKSVAGAPDVTRRMLVEPTATYVAIPLIVNSPTRECVSQRRRTEALIKLLLLR